MMNDKRGIVGLTRGVVKSDLQVMPNISSDPIDELAQSALANTWCLFSRFRLESCSIF